MEVGVVMSEDKSFAEKHPKINFIIGLFLLIFICAVFIFSLTKIVNFLGKSMIYIKNFLKGFVDSTDKVIIVAMITRSVSIVGVVISSIVAKVVDYRFNVKKYLYDKREKPYTQFIEMIYTMMEDSKKHQNEKLSEEEVVKMINELSKGLTLWGSNRVVKKWLKYRKSSLDGNNKNMLIELEDIIYEIRRDVGLGRRLKRGDMLSFFINDVEEILQNI